MFNYRLNSFQIAQESLTAMTLPSLEGDSNRLWGTGSPAVIELIPWE